MEIKGISNSQYFSKEINKPKSEKENEKSPKDKLEISEEGKVLQSNTTEVKNLESIKEKIANKFYDSDEVLDKVADKILQDLKKPVK